MIGFAFCDGRDRSTGFSLLPYRACACETTSLSLVHFLDLSILGLQLVVSAQLLRFEDMASRLKKPIVGPRANVGTWPWDAERQCGLRFSPSG